MLSIFMTSEVLAMAAQLLVVLALLELEDERLVALELAQATVATTLVLPASAGSATTLVAVDNSRWPASSTLSPISHLKLLDDEACRQQQPCTACHRFSRLRTCNFSLNVTKTQGDILPDTPARVNDFLPQKPAVTPSIYIYKRRGGHFPEFEPGEQASHPFSRLKLYNSI